MRSTTPRPRDGRGDVPPGRWTAVPAPGRARHRTGRAAAALVIAGLVLTCTAAVLGMRRPAVDAAPFDAAAVVELLAFLTFVLLGALLVVRRPEHPVGWLLGALGVAVLTQQAAQGYALLGTTGSVGPPGWQLASWVAAWSVTPPLVLLVVLLLLFPDGRPSSPAWRTLTWLVAAGGAALTICWAVALWPARGAALAAGTVPPPPALDAADRLLAACLPLAVLSLGLRHRRASALVRRQLRWLLLAALALVVAAVGALATALAGAGGQLVGAAGSLSLAGVAAAIALAVLRHRLYEIDRILSRTVSWLLLSAALATLYGAGVVGIGALLDPVSPDSSLAVAAATLAVAGAFNPLRSRMQHAVDRRFNREQHDRQQVVAGFGARLRDDVRLDALQTDLVRTIAHVVEPHRASVWLRATATRQSTGPEGSPAPGGSPA
jgi:hypothetical protein